jgi:hypothetical protein
MKVNIKNSSKIQNVLSEIVNRRRTGNAMANSERTTTVYKTIQKKLKIEQKKKKKKKKKNALKTVDELQCFVEGKWKNLNEVAIFFAYKV